MSKTVAPQLTVETLPVPIPPSPGKGGREETGCVAGALRPQHTPILISPPSKSGEPVLSPAEGGAGYGGCRRGQAVGTSAPRFSAVLPQKQPGIDNLEFLFPHCGVGDSDRGQGRQTKQGTTVLPALGVSVPTLGHASGPKEKRSPGSNSTWKTCRRKPRPSKSASWL